MCPGSMRRAATNDANASTETLSLFECQSQLEAIFGVRVTLRNQPIERVRLVETAGCHCLECLTAAKSEPLGR